MRSLRPIPILLIILVASCGAPQETPVITVSPVELPNPDLYCTPDPEKDDCRLGSDSEVSWQSCAVPSRDNPNEYCLTHTVHILQDPKARFINWPMAGMPNRTIFDSLTISHKGYTYPRPEHDILEHDISPPVRLSTQVFTGVPTSDKSSLLFTAVDGYIVYHGNEIRLQFVAYSQVSRDPFVPDYSYFVTNEGSPFAFTWDFPAEPVLQRIATESGLGQYPFSLGPEDPFVSFSAPIDAAPVVGFPLFSVLSPTGEPVFTLPSLAFRPEPE